MEISNTTMHQYIDELQECMYCAGLLGYAVARNTRILQENCKEYLDAYVSALNKYGSKQTEDTENGKVETLYIEPSSANFKAFMAEIEPLSQIKHEVDIFKISYKDAMDQLTAEQMLKLEWMLEDEEEMDEDN